MINFESFSSYNTLSARFKNLIHSLVKDIKHLRAGIISSILLAICSMPAYAVTFQAEAYTAFNDTTAGNQGGAYRSDNVDIEATSDTGGGFNVGWIDAGEWLAYNNLSIPTTGTYIIRMRVASASGGTASVDLNAGAIQFGNIAIPATGGWQTWVTVTKTVTINAGTYNLGVFAQTGGWNFNWIEIVANNGSTTGSIATLYQHCNYGGWSAGFNAAGSFNLSDITSRGGANDDASSIKVAAGYEAVIYQDANFSGASVVVSGDVSCLSNFNDMASSIVIRPKAGTGTPGTVNGTHKRLKIINGCGSPMWVQWLTAPTIQFNAANRIKLNALNNFVEFDIPDKGLPSMRFWPGFGCDANGQNCRVGASGGPASLGFTCPPGGCAPPIDSKFEASFGCIPGVSDGDCTKNPSAPTQPLGRGDWWNSSFVDGYTAPMKVKVNGSCPVGPQPAPVFGPGGPPGGVIDCSTIRVSDCPTNENLSTNGQFPALNSVNLIATNPTTGAQAGCYSAGSKLTFSHWANGFTTYPADSPQAKMYSCPTPPVSPEQCSAGPASKTKFHNMVHQHCATYTYPYDDGIGLSSCPAATDVSYEVTFYCPQ